jgi:DNA gyrase subunit A
MASSRSQSPSAVDGEGSTHAANGGHAGHAGGAPPRGRRGGSADSAPPPPPIQDTSLAEEAQRRYLNYALSVITSRALPDVRDGLKPVQRRILYGMHHDLHLTPDAKPKKSARVVGDVMGKYHPHGDASIYDAMVRLAQPFVMRSPLVDGQGNFGSPDGDAPAAMRYTEARLRPLAGELLGELGRRTVDWRPNYDGTTSEPIVLPARFPHLLVNGSQGIAVGMATSIPPHNLGEIVDACIALINQEDLPPAQLLKYVKGPDFPTGGQLHATRQELEAVYASGQGSLKLRGEWRLEGEDDGKRGPTNLSGARERPPTIIITSIPYAVERKSIVEKIAEIIITKKLASLVDVRDESTAEVRIVLELKKGTDPQLVMAYLFKNTALSVYVQVNLTCLTPTDNVEVASPKRLSLAEILRAFLDFRFATVTRRAEFDLSELDKRIHVLEGFEKVFDALDEVIRIIRRSEGRADAAEKLMARFKLSAEQADAILDLRLYRLAKLEILLVEKELGERRAEAQKLAALLKNPKARWTVIKEELAEIKQKYADKRRTKVVGNVDEPSYGEEDFIVAEDANVILSSQGWVKRVREVKDLGATRLREGDSVLAVVAGSTRAAVAFFSNLGGCYVARIHDLPSGAGYGDPVQKLFKLDDGERMVACLSFDPRALDVPTPGEEAGEPEPPFALAVTRSGFGFRFSLRQHREPSTRAGRRFAKPKEGDEVLAVMPVGDGDTIVCASGDGHVLGVPAAEIPALSGPGKGVIVMNVDDGERLVGATSVLAVSERVTLETDKGKLKEIRVTEVLGRRAHRGTPVVKRDRFTRLVPTPLVVPSLEVI